MEKNVDQLINETANKLAAVVNESHLPLSIVKLILTNMMYEIDRVLQQEQAPAPAQEEASDAKS